MSTVDKLQALSESRAAIEERTKTARSRIASLLDPQSFIEIGAFARSRSTDFNADPKETPADGVVTGYGSIEGRLVFVYSQEPSVLGGAVGERHAAKIADLVRKAADMGAPVVGILDSKGLRLQEESDSLTGYGKIYRAMADASGVVPQISLVLGTAAGGAALIAGLSDFTVMVEKKSQLFVSSANAMEKGTKFEDIASAAAHAEKSGMADIVCADEEAALAAARDLIDLLPANNSEDAPFVEDADDLNRMNDDFDALAEDPDSIDSAALLAEIADEGQFLQVKAGFAPNMVTGFMRLGGAPVGVVANNAAAAEGVLCKEACEKAAKFVRFCDAYEIPVLSVTNTCGFAADAAQEKAGLAGAAAQLVSAFASASVAKVGLLIGRAYGSAAMVMNSKASGADLVLAWPGAELSVMNAQSLARILFAKELADGADLAEMTEKAASFATAEKAAERGLVDDIIDPKETRKHLIAAFGMLLGKQSLIPSKKHNTL